MNAAAKAIHQSNFFSGQIVDMRLSKELWFTLVLLFSVLSSALIVVYLTNENRINFSQLQHLEQEAQRFQVQWGQLLLEQASLETPARIEQLAVDKLQMRWPSDKETFVLRNEK